MQFDPSANMRSLRPALLRSLFIIVLVAMLAPILMGGMDGYERNRQAYMTEMRAEHKRRQEEANRKRGERERAYREYLANQAKTQMTR